MKTHLEFRSKAFPPLSGEEAQINPGVYGKRLADFLAAELPGQGFEVLCVGAEDWGWMIELKNEAFPLWIGCSHYEGYEDGFLCFIEPSKPFIRQWFKKVETVSKIEPLALALEAILLNHGEVFGLRWWPENEVQP